MEDSIQLDDSPISQKNQHEPFLYSTANPTTNTKNNQNINKNYPVHNQKNREMQEYSPFGSSPSPGRPDQNRSHPSDSESKQKQINFFISPNNSSKKYAFSNYQHNHNSNINGNSSNSNAIPMNMNMNRNMNKNQLLCHTASQESLAYSSQTHYHKCHRNQHDNLHHNQDVFVPGFDIQAQRDTNNNDVSKTDTKYKCTDTTENAKMSKNGINFEGKTKTYKKNTDSYILLKQSQSQSQLLPKKSSKSLKVQNKTGPKIEQQDNRKTIAASHPHIEPSNPSSVSLSKRNKQLEYALQLQIISSQQLRTKVAILTQLLQHKIKDNAELAFLFKLANSSRNLGHVDIFVEMKKNQRKIKEMGIGIERAKIQNQQLRNQLEKKNRQDHSKQNINTLNISNSKASKLELQLQSLQQQKQSLFLFIEEQKNEYNKKLQQKDLQLKSIQQRSEKQVKVDKEKIKNLQGQIQKLQMQLKLLQYSLQQTKQTQIHNKNKKQSLISASTQTTIELPIQQQTQTNFGYQQEQQQKQKQRQLQLLRSELKLLSSQRDHYIKQFKKRINDSAENYLLKLQIRNYQGILGNVAMGINIGSNEPN